MTQAKNPPRNPRRRILLLLQDLGRVRADAAKRWNQHQQRHDGAKWRPLTEPEKLENRPVEWLRLLQQCEAMREQIVAVERVARFQLDWLRAQRDASPVPAQRGEQVS